MIREARSVRAAQLERTHQRLLDAAGELFLANGYARTSVGDLIRAAGVSRATFYAHFASKDAVLRELMTQVWDAATAAYAGFAELPDCSEANVRAWLEGLLDAWQRYGRLTLLVNELLAADLVAQSRERERRNVAVLIGSGRHWQHLPREEAERRAQLLIFQLERCMLEWVSGRWATPREALVGTLARVWIATLRAR